VKVFIEHAGSGFRCDQLGYWTRATERWHDFKAFLPALQLYGQRNLASAQILVIQEDGTEVRRDLPMDGEFSGPFSMASPQTAMGTPI
jgi:hypothetical protein